ncbi:MAG: hypothetical protein ACU84J_15470 [Gammaproteobacteria bacterium]
MFIKDEPVAQPWGGLAAVPTMLIVSPTGVMLVFYIFLCIGLFFFLAASLFALIGVMLIAPYFRPILVIIMLVIVPMSAGDGQMR